MHARRFSCMLLGMWLACSTIMTFIYADSANSGDRILRDHGPAASLRIKAMGRDEARALFAYPARQQARWWLAEWENVEVVLGAGFFFFLLFGTREGKLVLGFMLGLYALTLFQRYFTWPQLLSLGNIMDLAPANAAIPERNRLTAVQTLFTATEILKILLGLALGAYFIARTQRSTYERN